MYIYYVQLYIKQSYLDYYAANLVNITISPDKVNPKSRGSSQRPSDSTDILNPTTEVTSSFNTTYRV